MHRRFGWLTLGCLLLSGCTTPRLATIPRGEPLALVVAMRTDSPPHRVQSLTFSEDTKTGAKTGFIVGALAGISCGGPWILLCIPVYAVAGMYPGAIVGAGVGVVESLSTEKLDRLRNRLDRYRQAHNLPEALEAGIAARARKFWPVAADTAGHVVTVEVDEVLLTSTRDERITLIMRASVMSRRAGTPGSVPSEKKSFEYQGPISSYAAWVAEDGDFAELSFRSAIEHLASQIVAELAAN